MNNAQFLNEAAKAETRWSEAGLLDGLRSKTAEEKHIRRCTAILMENQRLANGLGNMMNENATDSSDVANFKRISIPLVRRIFPQLIANKIVSVQPLLGPVGQVFYLRFRYSSDKGSRRGGSNAGFPGDDNNSLQQTASGDVNLDIYYASQFVSNESSSEDDGLDTVSVFSPLEHTPVLGGSVTGTVYDGTTAVQNFIVDQSGNFTFTSIGSPSPSVSSATIDFNTGNVTMTWTSAPGANSMVLSYEYNMECNPDIPEINLAIESEEIVAKKRMLRAAWTWEAQQDIRSQHNLDAEAELTAILAQEINLEIDREILTDLRNNAGTVASWDFNTALGDTVKERYESLYIRLTEVSAVIHRKTLRGAANWIVTSPEVASIFETATAGFAPAPSDTFTSALGMQYVGSIMNKWKLYKDPAYPTNQLLLGYKGDSYADSGYFYCPYVPLTQTPVVLNPDSYCPSKGLLCRYGKKLIREGAKFYGRLSIANFMVS